MTSLHQRTTLTVVKAATPSNNLLGPLTSLIGRDAELRQLRGFFVDDGARLVTLTGPGGIGKTRLALAAAHEVLRHFPDGAFFVDLASVRDPALVYSAIARALQLREAVGRSLAEVLRDALREKRLLLVLDNFEQVLPAAAAIADLLAACPAVSALVTSRAPLRVRGEKQVAVPPLPVDAPPAGDEADAARAPAVELFIQRARDTRPDLDITDERLREIAAICTRLDGLPLAIELAAARVKLLPPRAILARLQGGHGHTPLTLLTSGPRDLPERQQTIRDAIAWSHDLLTEGEQAIFRRFAVFAGGATLESIEAACGGRDRDGAAASQPATLDAVAALVDNGLLRVQEHGDDEPRFLMLETVREYALEQLRTAGELDAARLWHAEFFLQLAELAEPKLRGAEQAAWLARLDAEHDNLRVALEWSLDRGAVEHGQRVAGALWMFWDRRGHLSEGRRWMDRVLNAGAGTRDRWRAKALRGAGVLAWLQGDYPAAHALSLESLDLYRALEDGAGTATALSNLGAIANETGEYSEAARLYEEALALFRASGDLAGTATALNNLGTIAQEQRDYERAARLHEESLAVRRRIGDTRGAAVSLNNAGMVALGRGDYDRATALFTESLALRRTVGDVWGRALVLQNLGGVARHQADYPRAAALYQESLTLRRELNDRPGILWTLVVLADVIRAGGNPARAARLLGAAAVLRDLLGARIPPPDQEEYERIVDATRAMLSPPDFTAAWTVGSVMPLEAAIQEAMATPDLAAPAEAKAAPPAGNGGGEHLTARELQVLRLVAGGRSNRQIASELVVSVRTVEHHVAGIFRKIDVHSRAEATAYAFRRGLAVQV